MGDYDLTMGDLWQLDGKLVSVHNTQGDFIAAGFLHQSKPGDRFDYRVDTGLGNKSIKFDIHDACVDGHRITIV